MKHHLAFILLMLLPFSCKSSTPCERILNFYHSNGAYKVQDCVQVTPQTVMWRIDTLMSWQNALFACRATQVRIGYKADLASFHNYTEFEAAMGLHLARPTYPSFSWSGLTGASGTWQWSDGSPYDYHKVWMDLPPSSTTKRGVFAQFRLSGSGLIEWGYQQYNNIGWQDASANNFAMCKAVVA